MMEIGSSLKGIRHAQQARLVERRAENLETDRSPFRPPAWQGDGGQACQIRRDRIDITEIQTDGIVDLRSQRKCSLRISRACDDITALKRPLEVIPNQGPDLLGLAIVGVEIPPLRAHMSPAGSFA